MDLMRHTALAFDAILGPRSDAPQTERKIVVTWVDPPAPCGGFYEAHFDDLGADDSPVGQGATKEEAIDDLLARGDA